MRGCRRIGKTPLTEPQRRVFTSEERSRLRSSLLEFAAGDSRIGGAAITGSAARDGEDRWSDTDLAFGVRNADRVEEVLSDWTARMYQEHLALHHVDVRAGAWVYRVFLLPNSLQVDRAFVPAAEFRALSPSFRLVSGEAKEPAYAPAPSSAFLVGMGWLYALHARSSIARGKLWQAEYMISGIRDHALALACLRHGLPAAHGRGFDQLPREVIARFEGSLVSKLDNSELMRAFRVAIVGLLAEIQRADAELAGRLQKTLIGLSDISV
jgi:hypothetical protein